MTAVQASTRSTTSARGRAANSRTRSSVPVSSLRRVSGFIVSTGALPEFVLSLSPWSVGLSPLRELCRRQRETPTRNRADDAGEGREESHRVSELVLGQDAESDVGGGDDRRRPWPLLEERDLAEEVVGAELGDRPCPTDHGHLAAFDQEEGVRELALADDQLSGGVFEPAAEPVELSALSTRQLRQRTNDRL